MVTIFQETQYAGPVSDIKLTGMEVELLTHFGLANESIHVCMHVVKTFSQNKGHTLLIYLHKCQFCYCGCVCVCVRIYK